MNNSILEIYKRQKRIPCKCEGFLFKISLFRATLGALVLKIKTLPFQLEYFNFVMGKTGILFLSRY